MAIFKVATAWSGTSGGPGITQLYFQDIGNAVPSQTQVQTAVNAVRQFWFACAGQLPNEIVLTTSAQVDVFNQANGELTNSVIAATPPNSVTGTDSGAYSMASGMKATLQTNEIRNGRRVRGAIYIVPAGFSSLTNYGVIASGSRNVVNAAGAALISSVIAQNVNLIVWGRPVKDSAGNVTRDGSVNYVQGFDTNEKGCVLRGRRD